MGSEPANGHWGTFQGLMRSISRGLDWPSPDFTTETAQLFLSFELGVAHHHSCSTQRQQDRSVLQILFCNSPPRRFEGCGKWAQSAALYISSTCLSLPCIFPPKVLIDIIMITTIIYQRQIATVYHSPVYSTKSAAIK